MMNLQARRVAVRLLSLCILVSLVAALPSGAENTRGLDRLLTQNPTEMQFEPVEFTPPKPERRTLENGMIVYLMPDHELPLITINAMIRTGAIYEPADKVGLAGLTGTVMRTGGAGERSGEEIDEALEFIAADIDTSIGENAGSASLDVLTKDFDVAIKIFADILLFPTFAPDKLELEKKRVLEGIRRRNDHPSGIASREFGKVLYGEHHPYGRVSTVETIQNITREDLQAFHRTYFRPNAMMVGVTGDFDPVSMLDTLRQAFGFQTHDPADLPPVPPVNPDIRPSVNHVEKDISQTHVRIGHLSIRQHHPDFFALSLLNDILGSGGFSSRLFQDVRTKQGLAYSVGSVLNPGTLDLGTFFLYAQTKSGSTHTAVTTMIEHFKRVREAPVTEEELKQAKDAFLNSFVFSVSRPAAIVNRLMALEYYGLPSDYLERYRANVIKLTAEDLMNAARTHLQPDQLIILTVGRAKDFDQPLSSFGTVRNIVLQEGE